MALLIDVMQHIDMNYVRELTPAQRRKFIEAAIKGGLKTLDDHSSLRWVTAAATRPPPTSTARLRFIDMPTRS
jgi:hypothetical protein